MQPALVARICVLVGYRHRLRKGLVGSSQEAAQDLLQQSPHKAGYYLQCTDSKGGWKYLYFFHLMQCFESDYAIYNWWCSAAPESAMRNMQIAAIQTEHGRVTYDGNSFKVFECSSSGERVTDVQQAGPLGSHDTDATLQKTFGIDFTQPQLAHIQAKV